MIVPFPVQRLFNLRFSEQSGEKRQVETFVIPNLG